MKSSSRLPLAARKHDHSRQSGHFERFDLSAARRFSTLIGAAGPSLPVLRMRITLSYDSIASAVGNEHTTEAFSLAESNSSTWLRRSMPFLQSVVQVR